MNSFEKLAAYFDSFDLSDPNYDYACYLREKIASTSTHELAEQHEEENNEADELETAESNKTHQNIEGKLMEPAFSEFEVLNELDKEKAEVAGGNENSEKAGEFKPITNFLNRIRG